MKILHICPTFQTASCGIGKYSNYLYKALKEVQPELDQLILGGFNSIHQALLNKKPDVCHVQLEYGFTSPQRLTLIDEYCHASGIKLVITFHSLAQVAHNVAASHAIQLAHTPLANKYGQFQVIKSGIPIVEPSSLDKIKSILSVLPAKDPYLFFGQAHPHKQLYELLRMIEGSDKNLLCIVSKPVQGSTDYYDKCRNLAITLRRNVYWVSDYLEDGEVLKLAEFCRAALFPYTEYGGIGISAAVKLLLNNSDLPIYTTFATHFSDIPEQEDVINKCFTLSEMLYSFPKHSVEKRQQWGKDHSFTEVAKEHLKIYGV